MVEYYSEEDAVKSKREIKKIQEKDKKLMTWICFFCLFIVPFLILLFCQSEGGHPQPNAWYER